jgi:uncharacterized protein (TIGR04145 family)
VYVGKIGAGVGGASALAATGTSVGPYLIAGLALVIVGFLVTRIAYRKRQEAQER